MFLISEIVCFGIPRLLLVFPAEWLIFQNFTSVLNKILFFVH